MNKPNVLNQRAALGVTLFGLCLGWAACVVAAEEATAPVNKEAGAMSSTMAVTKPAESKLQRALTGSESLTEAQKATPEEHAAKHADPTYICPMHPQIQQGEPGGCPICGMDLVLKDMSAAAGGDGLPVVSVNASTAQNMGVRTGKVKKRNLARSITTVGYVRYDEDKLHHLHANAAGWVKNPQVRALGDKVEAGQVLASYYSPQIYTAQEDYLTALRATGERQRQTDVLTRLKVMEIPAGIIRTLEQEAKITPEIPVLAPISGVVTQIGAQDGTYVSPSDVMYSIADLSTVWVVADVFPEQMSWVEKGARASISIDALPQQKWSGRVDYVYPELNMKTRTAQVRLKFDNADGLLKPNMFANVKITNRPATGILAIPREALIPTGDGYRVVKVTEENHYQPVEVTVGIRTEKTVQVLEGLEAGDEVVLSGQFLIDSESNLQASFQRMGN